MPYKPLVLACVLLSQIVMLFVSHAVADTEGLVRGVIFGNEEEIVKNASGPNYFKDVFIGNERLSPIFVAILFDVNPDLLSGLDISGVSSEDLGLAGAFAANANAVRIATWISARPKSLAFRTALLEGAGERLNEGSLISWREYIIALANAQGAKASLSWSKLTLDIIDNPDFESIIVAGLNGPDILSEKNKSSILESVGNTGRTEVFQRLVDLGFKSTKKAKQNLLVASAESRGLDELTVATALGGEVNEPNVFGMYALQAASPNKEKIQFLISKGASAKRNLESEMTSLERAVRSGNIAAVEVLLSAGGDPLQHTSGINPVPLVALPAQNLDVALVKTLLNAKSVEEVKASTTAEILPDLLSNWTDSSDSRSQLDSAVPAMIEVLVLGGVDVNAQSQIEYRRSAEVALIQNPSVLPKLISLGADTMGLFEVAIKSLSPSALVTLAEQNLNPPQQFADGTYVVRKVVDSERDVADVFFTNWAPDPPHDIKTVPYVAYAALIKSVPAIKYFASKGASLDQTYLDISPLEFSINSHNIDAVYALFDSGLPVASVDQHMRNAFHFAAKNLSDEDRALDASILRALLARNVPLLARDQWDKTPRDYLPEESEVLAWYDSMLAETLGYVPLSLHQAIFTNDPRIVSSAIAHGAALDDLDSAGNTPLQMALKMSSSEVVSLLLSAGAKINLGPLGSRDDATLFLSNEDMSRVVLPFLLTEDVVDRTAFDSLPNGNVENNSFKFNQNIPIEGAWNLTCYNECEGTDSFSVSADYDEHAYHTSSKRHLDPGKGAQELAVEFMQIFPPPVYERNVPVFNQYTTLGPFDFSLQGSFTIPPCTFSVNGARPCTPLLKITNNNSVSTMVVGQSRGDRDVPTITIGPKESAYFDRTSGALTISVTQPKSQQVGFKFTIEAGVDVPQIKECCSYSNRAANYVTLIKLRNEANAALKHNTTESLARYKTLAAIHRKETLDLLALNTLSALRHGFTESVRLLESMDVTSFELLRIMKVEGKKPVLQRPLIEKKLRDLIDKATSAQARADLKNVLSYVSAAGENDDELRIGLQRLQIALLRATSQQVEVFQLLALEIKEYSSDPDLLNIPMMSPATKISISNRVHGLVDELQTAQGSGATALKKAIGFLPH